MIKNNKSPVLITVFLSNGLSATIPFKNWRETVKELEANIDKNQLKKPSLDSTSDSTIINGKKYNNIVRFYDFNNDLQKVSLKDYKLFLNELLKSCPTAHNIIDLPISFDEYNSLTKQEKRNTISNYFYRNFDWFSGIYFAITEESDDVYKAVMTDPNFDTRGYVIDHNYLISPFHMTWHTDNIEYNDENKKYDDGDIHIFVDK